jgi:signal transduction histidine kinase
VSDYIVKGTVQPEEMTQAVLRALNSADARLTDGLQRQLAEQTRVLSAVDPPGAAGSEALAILSHELRTPLTPISGFVKLLLGDRNDPSTAGQRLSVEMTLENSVRLARLVDELLQLQRLQAGTVLLEVAPTNIRAVVEQAVRVGAASAADNTRLQVTGFVAQATPPLVSVAAMPLSELTAILVDNATRFTPQGEVRVQADWNAAKLVLESTPGEGTRVTVEMPCAPHAP